VNSIEYNLGLGEAMLGELDAYLSSRALFWPLGRGHPPGSTAYPMLSIGGLLLVMDELAAAENDMHADQRQREQELIALFDSTEQERQVALKTKCTAEASSRLNLWRAYIQDVERSEAGEWGYRNEVRQRVMLARLMDLPGEHPDLQDIRTALSGLDGRLRARFSSGEFVWDDRLQQIYPKGRFWFLYGKPRSRA
jgi:hypothetical protein